MTNRFQGIICSVNIWVQASETDGDGETSQNDLLEGERTTGTYRETYEEQTRRDLKVAALVVTLGAVKHLISHRDYRDAY